MDQPSLSGGRGRGHRQGHSQQQRQHQQQQQQQSMGDPGDAPPPRRELRRPHGGPEDLARAMQGLDPFGDGGYGYGGVPQPAPCVDGWSSGENTYDPNGLALAQQQAAFGGGHQQRGGHYGNNGRYHNSGRGYRGGGPRHQHHQQHQYCPPNTYYQQHFGNRTWTANQQQGQAQQQQYQQSNWNVRVPEFVPKSTLNVTATEFVPRSMARNTSSWAQQEVYDPMQQVDTAIKHLTYSPGKFEVTAAHLTEVLNASIADLQTMQNVVDRVFETCLSEVNFRYTGARLLDHLAATVAVTVEEEKMMRDVLLEKCYALHSTHKELITSDPGRYRSFTLFMADLFLQFGVYAGDVKQRITILCDAVTELLTTLAEQRPLVKDNLITIAQALKMAGSALEVDESLRNEGQTPKLDELMKKVEDLANVDQEQKDEKKEEKAPTTDVPPHILQMMTNLVELRKNKWGQRQQRQQQQQCFSSSAPQTADNSSYSRGEGGYGLYQQTSHESPQEFELTAEERAFMKEHLGQDMMAEIGDFDDEDDTGMSPEIEAAYEEFIANQSSHENH